MNSARYLLRFDDLCPTVSAERWPLFESLIEEFNLRPILAVVPDNRDPELQISPPDPGFWDRMRALEAAGAAIALHGYRHLCVNSGRSLVDLHRTSEFAGVPLKTQRALIREGVRILRDQGLHPSIWVAPRHGFDKHTIEALLDEGISLLSDGFTCVPFRHDGMTWIPQQLWAPVEKPSGLWTICVHPNTAGDAEIANLRRFVAAHAKQFTSVELALFRFQPDPLTLAERTQAECALRRLKLSHAVRPLRRFALLRMSKSA